MATSRTPRRGRMAGRSAASGASGSACRDPRVWALFVLYGACFGMEFTIDNIAALYFFGLLQSLLCTAAGRRRELFGMMNLFARALGGIVSDRCTGAGACAAARCCSACTILLEGLALLLLARAGCRSPSPPCW